MQKLSFTMLVLACSTGLLVSCDSKIATPSTQEEKMTTPESYKPRTRAPLPKELIVHLDQMMKSVMRVVSKQVDLKQEETFLGEGKNHAEKDTLMLLMRSYSQELDGKRSGIVFKRRSDQEVWSHGYFHITPTEYPRDVYDMNLPASFFAGMTLAKAYVLERPGFKPPRDNIFEFNATQNGVKLLLTFECPIEVSNVEDKYPKSFIRLNIKRVD